LWIGVAVVEGGYVELVGDGVVEIGHVEVEAVRVVRVEVGVGAVYVEFEVEIAIVVEVEVEVEVVQDGGEVVGGVGVVELVGFAFLSRAVLVVLGIFLVA
jgi:hypothetical protein